MSEGSSTPPYQVVTHGEILRAIHKLGRKLDVLIDHLGADEDWKIIAATEQLRDSSDELQAAINSQSTPTQKEANAITNP